MTVVRGNVSLASLKVTSLSGNNLPILVYFCQYFTLVKLAFDWFSKYIDPHFRQAIFFLFFVLPIYFSKQVIN